MITFSQKSILLVKNAKKRTSTPASKYIFFRDDTKAFSKENALMWKLFVKN